MGQKVNPNSYRLGILKPWHSTWFVHKKDYAAQLQQDQNIRQLIDKVLPQDIVSKVFIERTLKVTTVTICSNRPGIIIGPKGEKIQALTQQLKDKLKKPVQINIQEVRMAELDATLVAKKIAKKLEGRESYRRAAEMAIKDAMRARAKGIKIELSGRLGGVEIARKQKYHDGCVPLHTIRADIDFSQVKARTIYGVIGVKVWISLKEVYGKRDLSIKFDAAPKHHKSPARKRF